MHSKYTINKINIQYLCVHVKIIKTICPKLILARL